MILEPATAIAAGSFVGNSVILGGALAGGLHAVSGPDHFPALLPRCLGKTWLAAAKVGGLWGLGHALSAMAMGMVAFFIKEKSFTSSGWMAKLAFGVDIAIGLSLVVIGFLSLQEAKGRDFKADINEAANEVKASEKQSALMKMNMVINGVFHGLALDGIPTLMPVLGATSVSAAVSFLLSYGAGVIVAMTCATIFIGHGTRSIARNSDFDLGKLIRGSAIAAIIIGFAWSGRAIFFP